MDQSPHSPRFTAVFVPAAGNLAGKTYLILSGEFVYYHEKGKASTHSLWLRGVWMDSWVPDTQLLGVDFLGVC